MARADKVYKRVIKLIAKYGKWDEEVRPRWADGTPAHTKAVLNVQMKFDNGKEIPLLTTKAVPRKDPVNEMLWIWQHKSNNVVFLREVLKCKVWNEWERADGTIGKAYGWQLRNKRRRVKITQQLIEMIMKGQLSDNHERTYDGYIWLDQVDYLIYMLMTNPYSRRIKTTLWCVEDLDDMALEPCVYETHWQMWDGKLNLTVCVRSNDMGLGNPYNIYQYAILHRMIAQVTGHEVGEICFNIDNAHIYDRHEKALLEQVQRETYEAPIVTINPNIVSFYDFTIDDIKVENYNHGAKVPLEVAI